ncbi:MAG: helix-turn-helix domain-containing protein [Thermodesulfobacteriota bacterium]
MPCLEDNEKQLILSVLEKTGWRIKGTNGAAEILKLKPSTLYSKMEKLGIPSRRIRTKKDDIST